MKRRIPSVPVVLSSVAVFASLGGGAAVAATGWSGSEHEVKNLIAHSTAENAHHLAGQPPSYYLAAKHFVSSGGEHFFGPGQTVTLGKAGHFRFTASCTSATDGSQEVSFNVLSNATADLDGTGPAARTGASATDSNAKPRKEHDPRQSARRIGRGFPGESRKRA